MALRSTVVGSYPKPPEEGQQFVVRKTLHALEKGDKTVDDLKKAQDDLVRAVIGEEEAAGIDLITDGQGRWDDILTPFARNIAGFEIGGLLRWFDNNVYYRRPVAVGPLEWRGPTSVEAFTFASSVATKPVKAVLPGPVTFARLSQDEHFSDHEAFVLAIAGVLAQEAAELEAAGATVIQIDEPALLDAPEDLDLAKRAIAQITSELSSVETILATYFGDAKRLGAELFDIEVDGFGFDLVAGPENLELLSQVPDGKNVQVGLLDARNTKLETVDELTAAIEPLVEQFGADRLYISPSAGLEYLPREKARAKLDRLGEVVKKVGA
ncbi:MAG: 5-methyltetrahydropteroyltriglutamate--homocysteine methyltransferase [Actinomycetota bacterium]|nr:5-methyltetrahydropteroyltriglutamate--homocysteine methyltransferase [Actinomycetota bacterium]